MKARGIGVAAILCLVAAGCASTATETKQMSDLHVCLRYGELRGIADYLAEPHQSEIKRRDLLNSQEWNAVEQKSVFIGMSLCGMYASLGRPTVENETVTARTLSIQHVYRFPYANSIYVYTENGYVRSWQN